MIDRVRSHGDQEPPLFALDETDEPDDSEELVSRGGPIRSEGVQIPSDVIDYGNGLLPDSLLQRIGIGSHRLHSTAAAAFGRLRDQAAAAGIDLTCTDSYRTLNEQKELKQRKPTLSATPGRSVHGWGFAVDVSIGSPPKPFGMTVLRWLKENGPVHGWFLGRPRDEPWHWVYRGTETSMLPADNAGLGTYIAPNSDQPTTTSATTQAGTTQAKIVRGLLGLPPGDQFDDATLDAVRGFQQANGLVVDGVAGPLTFAALCRVTAPTDRPELAVDSTGEQVRWLQRRLGRTPDGVFGPRTESTVIEFQRNRGLTPDGKVGRRTWAALVG